MRDRAFKILVVLIVAGFETFRFEALKDIRDVSRSSMIVMGATFLATLVLPIQEAILVGIVLSIIDFVYTSAQDVEVVELVLTDDGRLQTKSTPVKVADDRVTVLYGWGNLFFAGARKMEAILPQAKDTQRAVVILRLHGHIQIRSTFILVLERYAQKLQANGGKLILSGVNERVKAQLERTETTETIPEEDIFMATNKLGDSTRAAIEAAETWLVNEGLHA